MRGSGNTCARTELEGDELYIRIQTTSRVVRRTMFSHSRRVHMRYQCTSMYITTSTITENRQRQVSGGDRREARQLSDLCHHRHRKVRKLHVPCCFENAENDQSHDHLRQGEHSRRREPVSGRMGEYELHSAFFMRHTKAAQVNDWKVACRSCVCT